MQLNLRKFADLRSNLQNCALSGRCFASCASFTAAAATPGSVSADVCWPSFSTTAEVLSDDDDEIVADVDVGDDVDDDGDVSVSNWSLAILSRQ